jgi:hypothetical protein
MQTASSPPIPRFDANPERIRVDSDAIGGTAHDVGASTVAARLAGLGVMLSRR